MKNGTFYESLINAVNGITRSVRSERNLRIHIAASVVVIACAVLFGLTGTEKAIVIALCAAVICAEQLNTAIENTVDMLAPSFNMYAKQAKDAAAGAVLVISIGAAISGILIFLPYAIRFISAMKGIK